MKSAINDVRLFSEINASILSFYSLPPMAFVNFPIYSVTLAFINFSESLVALVNSDMAYATILCNA